VPIHDQSYRRYRGEKESVRSGWTVIAVAGVTTFLKKRMFLGFLLFAWIPFIVRSVQIYVSANYPQVSMLAMKAESFRDFFDQQGVFVFFMTVFVGSGLIASDRRANALQIYLSKPLTRSDYIAGKMAVLMTFLLLVTWLPGILLLLLQVAFAGSLQFLKDNIYLVPAITVFSLVQVIVASFSMLALSSLSNSPRFVAVMYAGLVLFTKAMAEVVGAIMGSSGASWLSFSSNIEQVGDLIFRMKLRYDTPVAISLLVLVALVVVSLSILERKVRGVEVVT
jgi:ABC-2 type transport system permease protein